MTDSRTLRPLASALCPRSQALSRWNSQAPGPSLPPLRRDSLGCQWLTQPLLLFRPPLPAGRLRDGSDRPMMGSQGKRAALLEGPTGSETGNIPCFWKLRSKKLTAPLLPSRSPFPWLDFLWACPGSLPVVPSLPQPLPNPLVPHAWWPWERRKGGFPLPSMYPALLLIFNYQGCGSY